MLGKRKRATSIEPQQRDSLLRVLTEQLDLEIALKGRLLAAARARIEWADILKSKLTQDEQQPAVENSSTTSFRDAALTVYEAIETSCLIITSNKSRLLAPLTTGRPPPSAPPPIEAPRTRKRVTLGLAQAPTSAVGPLLFEDRGTSTTVKLVCTDCSRSDFPTMQGFLNHCRLAHSRIYNTHDECIQATGVKINNAERDILMATGVEVNTVHLLSLQGMFQRAVGLSPGQRINMEDFVEDASEVSTILSQTLGLHRDTPTLAPFLGKEVRKKVIHVYDEEQSVDILKTDKEADEPYYRLRVLQYRNRKTSDEALSLTAAVLAAEQNSDISVALPTVSQVKDAELSRFHVSRRVTISDRSLYLSESKRPRSSPTHTHRWQLTVSSPSYAQHITTFLDHFTVTCVTQPPVFPKSITVIGPPFVACSTADRPFLARLTLHWVDNKNHPFEVDHWVELDILRTSRVVFGEEQMFDVELDRNTEFRLKYNVENTVSWDGQGDYQGTEATSQHILRWDSEPTLEEDDSNYVTLLKKLVSQFPIIMQASAHLSKLPYPLQPSRAKFLGLIPGRRKAIEWARALAIQKEYNTQATSSGLRKLTTAEVFRWLDANGLYPRPPPPVPPRREQPLTEISPEAASATPPRFCRICGVNLLFHSPTSRCSNYYRTSETDSRIACECSTDLQRRRAPIMHIYSLLSGHPYPNSPVVFPSNDIQHLVKLAHPKLTCFVHREASSVGLSCVPRMKDGENVHRIMQGNELSFGSGPKEIDDILAPYAYLALVVGRVIRDLANNGLQVAREMQSRTKGAISENATQGSEMALLTPTHILQSLVIKDASQGGGRREALSKCLSRVGTVLSAQQET